MAKSWLFLMLCLAGRIARGLEGPAHAYDPFDPGSVGQSFISRLFGYTFGFDYPFEPLTSRTRFTDGSNDDTQGETHSRNVVEATTSSQDAGTSQGEPSTSQEEEDPLVASVKAMGKIGPFDFTDVDTWDEQKFKKMVDDILTYPHPLFGTQYAAGWGHVDLTEAKVIPPDNKHAHLDIYDRFLPRGIKRQDLRCLFLYTVEAGYCLYKVKFGDMVVTLRPDVDTVNVHVFEKFGGKIVVRIIFRDDRGTMQKHEYTETKRKSKIFVKTLGNSQVPPPEDLPPGCKFGDEQMAAWCKRRCDRISEMRPPIAEEVLSYTPDEGGGGGAAG